MRVIFYTYDCLSGRERLMPWRTVLEAASNLASCSGYTTEVRDAAGIFTDSLSEEDVLFFPVTWRMGIRNLNCFKSIKAEKIAYVPGGVYPLSGVFSLIKSAGFRIALPYLLDAIVPHHLLMGKLKRTGFSAFIGQTQLTTDDAVKHGWPIDKSFTAIPGMDMGIQEKDFSVLKRLGLEGQKFLLYSGAPAPIRGSQLAIRAFDRIVNHLGDVKFVMLMRTDNGSDYSEFDRNVTGIKHKDRFVIVRERLTSQQLGAFFSSAYAAVLPFILIPSEMPLTYFELLACGTPVISFSNGGTTEYLRPALKLARRRSVKSLAAAMLELCADNEERKKLSTNGIELMKKHPTWMESSKIWARAIVQNV